MNKLTTTRTRWAWAMLLLVAAVALYTEAARMRFPLGDKYFFPFGYASEDLRQPLIGAKALLMRRNPYTSTHPELALPHGWTQTYPPSMLVMYVPLAWAANGQFEPAAKIFFHLNLLWVAGLAWLVSWLVKRLWPDPADRPVAFVAPIFVALLLCPAGKFTLERAQNEFLTALLAYGALVCFLRRRAVACIFLGVLAAGLKGYALPLTVGLGLLLLERKQWKQVLIGGVAAAVLVVLPVIHYYDDAFRTLAGRLDMFIEVYFNHGFANVMQTISPAAHDPGRVGLILFSLVASALSWLGFRRAFRRAGSTGADRSPEPAEATADEVLWGVLFACCALTTMVGAARMSSSYTLDLVLPAAIVLGAGQHHLVRIADLSRTGEVALRGLFTVILTALFLYRIEGQHTLPLGGYGMVALLLLSGTLVTLALIRRASARQPSRLVESELMRVHAPDAHQ